ncbi:MAG: DUF423 domain-containing protein [Crocinitomix sp.]|nr:DUF423 domain-containing protein [Crocinitomix sp.]
MSKKIVLTGGIFVLLGIILGAMAAHALEDVISASLIETFEKGVKYQFYVGLGLLAVGFNAERVPFNLKWFYLFNLLGVIIFSGCIYLYSLHEIIPSLRPAAMIVPIGGLSMIIGWTIFVIQIGRSK